LVPVLPESLCAVGRARVGGRIAERAARALERVSAGRERVSLVSATSLIEWCVPLSLVTHAESAPAAALPGGRPVESASVAAWPSRPHLLSSSLAPGACRERVSGLERASGHVAEQAALALDLDGACRERASGRVAGRAARGERKAAGLLVLVSLVRYVVWLLCSGPISAPPAWRVVPWRVVAVGR